MARKHSFTLRVRELSEHGFSLRNRVRKDKSSGRVICSDRAKACHDRRLHIEKHLILQIRICRRILHDNLIEYGGEKLIIEQIYATCR